MASVRRRPTSPLTGGVQAPRTTPKKSVRRAVGGVTGTTVVTGTRPRRPSLRPYASGGAPVPKSAPRPAQAQRVDMSGITGGLPEGMQAAPQVGLGTAPPTSTGEGLRIDARNQYNSATAGLNYQAYQAALAYGDPTTLAQFSQFGPVVDNPNSALNQIKRAETTGIQGVSDAALRNNTWTGSLRLRDQQGVSDEANRQRLAAKNAWDQANYQWSLNSANAWEEYQRYLRQADQQDYDAWLASQPEPRAPEPAPAPAAAAPAPARAQAQQAQAERQRQQAMAAADRDRAQAQKSVKRKKKR